MSCLRCGERQELVVALDRRGVPHGAADHNVMYDWSTVLACPACEQGELRVFSHDCWSDPRDEEWDMEWSAQLPAADLALVRQGVAACPDPAATACDCATHVSLRETRTHPAKLLLGRAGERPDAHVTLRDDGVPEFVRQASTISSVSRRHAGDAAPSRWRSTRCPPSGGLPTARTPTATCSV